MFPASLLLLLLIIAMPVALIFDGPTMYGLIMAITALSAALVALRLRPGEFVFLTSVIRPVATMAALPAIWMLIQITPLKFVGLNNPVWESASAALGQPIAGSISIDPGATLISLTRYLSAFGILLVAAGVTIDRHRAEWILYALTGSTTLIAIVALAAHLDVFAHHIPGAALDAATESAALGINFAVATALHTYERSKTRGTDRAGSMASPKLIFSACVIAVVICTAAIFAHSTIQVYFSVLCGITILLMTNGMRRLGAGPWEFSAIIAAISVIAIAGITLKPGIQTMGLTLAFASHSPSQLIALTQRILAETNWTGTGAGTFASVLPVYRDVYELAAGSAAPTAAAAIAVEMGKPFLWVILLTEIVLAITLLRSALRRGRDSLYPTVGASCVVTATVIAFGNSALFSIPVLIITASSIGIAIAQSKGRSTR